MKELDAVRKTKAETAKNAPASPTQRPVPIGNRSKSKFLVSVGLSIILVAGIWYASLRINWQRISQITPPSYREDQTSIENLKNDFNQLIDQTSTFIDNVAPPPDTGPTSTSTESVAGQETNNLNQEKLKKISEQLKSEILDN